MKNVLGVLLMMFTVLFWMGCEKDPLDPNNNNNSGGTTTHNGVEFNNSNGVSADNNSLLDFRDNTVYPIIQIGNQTWMAENLRYDVPGSTSLDTVYPGAALNYGRLYDSNPSAVQGICPSGWHLPSDSEWNELEMALGMPAADTANTGWRGTDHGTKMKSTTGWNSSGNGTNASGFNAFPAGGYSSGSFGSLSGIAYFWSSTENNASNAWNRNLIVGNATVVRNGSYIKTSGFSCRCVEN